MFKVRNHFLILTGALCSFLAQAQKNSDVLARIGNRTLTVGEFKNRYEQNSNLSPGEKPSKEEVLNNIVYFELATQEARKMRLDQDPGVKDQIDILLYQELVRRKVQPEIDKLRVSESEVLSFYKESPLVRTKHIVLLTRPDMTEKSRAELKKTAEGLMKRAKENPSKFSELAKEYSEGPSAKTGGDVDWGARHKLLEEFYEAALALKKPGEISDVVETPYGYHIIQLQGIREYKDIDKVYKNFVVRSIKEKRGKSIYDAYFEGLKNASTVKINESLL
ncbi:hypothetical protein GW915_02010 [bacterium]|nr:hypothetical protein [bacterium]